MSVYAEINALIRQLPPEQEERVRACAREIEKIVERYGDEGFPGLALVGAAAEELADRLPNA